MRIFLVLCLVPLIGISQPFDSYVRHVYNLSSLDGKLSYTLFYESMLGYHNLRIDQKLSERYITIVDFRQSSTEKRFYVYDLLDKELVHRTFVAHGKNSGGKYAVNYSNKVGSFASSRGFYKTGKVYLGANGISLKLHGLDAGLNDNVLIRNIVIHSANYVSKDSVGKSEGCLAIPNEECSKIIEKIKEGSCVYVKGFCEQKKSKFLKFKKTEYNFETLKASEELLELLEH